MMMKYLIVFFALLSIGYAQQANLPIGTKPYSSNLFIAPDGAIWTGKPGHYTNIATKDYVDALIKAGYTNAQVDSIALDTYNRARNRTNHTGTQAISTVAGLQSVLDSKIQLSEKGSSNGVATLDQNSKVPMSQIPDALVGSVNYQGTWNTVTNTPSLPFAPSAETKGHYYIVSFPLTPSQPDSAFFQADPWGLWFRNGDWIISNGSVWGKVDNNNKVVSVNGKQGAVVVGVGDISGLQGFLDGKANVNGINASGTWPIGINGSAKQWGGNDFSLGENENPQYFITSLNGQNWGFSRPTHIKNVIGADVNPTPNSILQRNEGGNIKANHYFMTGGFVDDVSPEGIISYDSNGILRKSSKQAVNQFLGSPAGGDTFGTVAGRGNRADVGDIVIGNQVNGGFTAIQNSPTRGAGIQAFHDTEGAKNLLLQPDGGRVGVGNTNPTKLLDAFGGAIIGAHGVNSNETKLFLRNTAGKTWALSSGANEVEENHFAIYDAPTGSVSNLKFMIDGITGNVGMGTPVPTAKLHVNGGIKSESSIISKSGDFIGDTPAAANRGFISKTNGSTRWFLAAGDDNPETGGGVGSDFTLYRYNDEGGFLGRSMRINRSTSETIFSGTVRTTHATPADNNADFQNTSPSGYGFYSRGGGGAPNLYIARFDSYSGTALIINAEGKAIHNYPVTAPNANLDTELATLGQVKALAGGKYREVKLTKKLEYGGYFRVSPTDVGIANASTGKYAMSVKNFRNVTRTETIQYIPRNYTGVSGVIYEITLYKDTNISGVNVLSRYPDSTDDYEVTLSIMEFN